MVTLRIEPGLEDTDYPFYTKLRADVDQRFLRRGEGTLYLGFHIDPLYRMHWNNAAPPLEYELTAPAGVRVIPAAAAFPVVDEPPTPTPGSSCSTYAPTTAARRSTCVSPTTPATKPTRSAFR